MKIYDHIKDLNHIIDICERRNYPVWVIDRLKMLKKIYDIMGNGGPGGNKDNCSVIMAFIKTLDIDVGD